MNQSQIFNPEIETWRLMEQRFQTDGALVLKLRRQDASSLERSFARNKWLDAQATKQGVFNSFQYWTVVAWEIVVSIFRYILAPNAARTREFYLANGRKIASVDFLSCPDEPKYMLVCLNHTATPNE